MASKRMMFPVHFKPEETDLYEFVVREAEDQGLKPGEYVKQLIEQDMNSEVDLEIDNDRGTVTRLAPVAAASGDFEARFTEYLDNNCHDDFAFQLRHVMRHFLQKMPLPRNGSPTTLAQKFDQHLLDQQTGRSFRR